jgi:two-component system CheB/CheR fusion protein
LRFPLIGEDGLPYSICTQSRDITNLKHHRDELQLAATVIANAAEGIMVTDVDQNIISVNDSFTRITGYEEAEVLKHKPNFLSSKVHDKAFYHDMWHSIKQRGWWQGEITNRHKDGTLLSEWLTINEVRDDNQQLINYLGIFSDISVIKRSQERVEYLATHDDLTDLPNRVLFTDRLKHALARAARNGTSITIMFCDLDNFKVINDTLGHETGDQLLIQAALRLTQCIREEDTVARIGGDEFIILVEDSHDDEIETMALRILDALSASFHVDNRDLYVSLSIGISQAPSDGEDAETLMKNADAAMYQSKENGKNQVSYFAEHMRLSSQHRLTIETGIRVALKGDGFYMLYQPVYATGTSKIESFEALIRWDNKLLNITMPDQFIPVAEKSGLISLLDQWVIRSVMRQVRQWLDLGLKVPPIAMNLSGQHFNSNALKECLEEQLGLNNLAGEQFVLEVTEQTLVSSISVSEGKLNDIVELGFAIAIDDFGTGYSSLSYLQRMPIDVIKIDRSFIDQIHEGNDDYNISRAIINLAKSLGLDIVAEGVELEEQVKILQQLECPKSQGYYYSKPVTSAEVEKLLQLK